MSPSRVRYSSELLQSRTSSPHMEEYATATATSFDAARDAVHSTVQLDSAFDKQGHLEESQLRLFAMDPRDGNDSGSDSGSASMMSIEVGRGVKRSAAGEMVDVSQEAIFNLGGDGTYEVTGTPPTRVKSSLKMNGDGLKRQASIRRAIETQKIKDDSRQSMDDKRHPLSNALNDAKRNTSNQYSRRRQTPVASRFASGAAQQPVPSKNINNPTVESNQSFLLPENFPDLTELVVGSRRGGSGAINRNKKSRSRFTSASYRPSPADYLEIDSIPIPDEEKAIYTSIQLLRDRNDFLESENAAAVKRIEEYEERVIELQAELVQLRKRTTSGSGTRGDQPDASASEISIRTLHAQLERAKQKTSSAAANAQRLKDERDILVQQIGKVYVQFEKTKAENEEFRDNQKSMEEVNDDLVNSINVLKSEMREMQAEFEQSKTRNMTQDMRQGADKSKLMIDFEQAAKETMEQFLRSQKLQPIKEKSNGLQRKENVVNAVGNDDTRRRSTGQLQNDNPTQQSRPKAHREGIVRRDSTRLEDRQRALETTNSRRKTQQNTHSTHTEAFDATSRQSASAPVAVNGYNANKTVRSEYTSQSINGTKLSTIPGRINTVGQQEEDTRDYTYVSILEPNALANMRKKMEEELRAGKLSNTCQSTRQSDAAPYSTNSRKISAKDITAGLDDAVNSLNLDGIASESLAKSSKTVRVLSPNTSDEIGHIDKMTEGGDGTLMSNISRRRRRALSGDGETSAFIIPDITLQGGKLPAENGSIPHDPKTCTACPESAGTSIALPVAVTDRPEYDQDATSATIRPSQSPSVALATILKQLEDEIKHLKIKLASCMRLYGQHDPAISKRRRMDVKLQIDRLTGEIEKRSNQVYALYDVLEGQKAASAGAQAGVKSTNNDRRGSMTEEELNNTLQSIGIDMAEFSGRIGRSVPADLDGADELDDSTGDLPWEGLSAVEESGDE